MEKTKPSSSRLCSDEELQKAIADLEELVSRCSVPDEFKFPGDEEELNLKTEKKKEKEKEKKKICKLTPEEVQLVLSYRFEPFQEHYGLAQQEDDQDLRTMTTVSDVLLRHCQDGILAAQEEIRHDLETKGYVTYETTEDEAEQEEAHRGPRGTGGRRRHRPGVTKHAGGVVKKLN
uniref:Uncharacterized protein n=1 Tax=Arundo donax TaxID=35708 RepID=A0A0A9DKP3_ARUDO